MKSAKSIWQSQYNHPGKWDVTFPPLSLPEMFFTSAKRKGEAPVLDFMGRKYSYAKVAKAVRSVAKGLQEMGLGKGDRIGLFLPNTPHYVAAYYGALAAGATVVNFSPLYTVEELSHQVEDSGASILITLTASALLPSALEVLEKSSLKRLVVGSVEGTLPCIKSLLFRLFKRSDITKRPSDERITKFSELLANDGSYAEQNIDPENDVAILQYTGGTTGVPKGAMLTHQNLTANARQINAIDPRSDDEIDRVLGVLPFFHVFANTAVLNRSILNGAEIVMLPRFDAKQALAAINRTKPTAMPGVPTMYQALMDHTDISKTSFASMRACVAGGAPLAVEVKARFEKITGSTLVEGYGLTESSGVVCCNPYEGLNKTGTIGQPIPGTTIRLLDKNDPSKSAPEGEPGELIFSGPQVMKGYWNKPEADAEVFVDGYLRTGDVAMIDDQGYISIVDRIKDMLTVGGFNVFPSRIEAALYSHNAVQDALVIGIRDSFHGEKPKAYVTLRPGQAGSVDGAALKDWVNPQLGKHERVIDVIVRDALPKTMIGKLDRKALRAEVLG